MDIKEVISSGVIELYVLGIATEQEVQLVEDCIANHSEETLAEINSINEALAVNAKFYAKEPPAGMEDKIASKIFGNKEEHNSTTTTSENKITHHQTAKVVQIKKPFKYLAAASIALLIGSIIGNVVLFNKYKNNSKDISKVQTKLDEQIALNKNMDVSIDAVTNPNALAVSLPGTQKHPEALAKIYWIKNTGDVYIDPTNLPTAPKGMQYQFWGIVDGVPVDGGLIFKNGKVKIEKLKTFGKAQAFAITLEKEGGVPQPTMENMYVMAKT